MSTGSQDFDPYFKWLGIRPKDQPPTHYRLLGIDLFESDLDVIEQAADRQMAHLRTFQAGPHSQQSQKLLNEVAAARIALLNAEEKKHYDASLRRRVDTLASAEREAAPPPLPAAAPLRPTAPASPQPATPKPTLVAKPLSAAQPLAAAPPAVGVPAIDLRKTIRRKRGSPATVVVAVTAGVAALLLGGLAFRQWRPAVPEPTKLVADRPQATSEAPGPSSDGTRPAGHQDTPAATDGQRGENDADKATPEMPTANTETGDANPPSDANAADTKSPDEPSEKTSTTEAMESAGSPSDSATTPPTAVDSPQPSANTTETAAPPDATAATPEPPPTVSGGFSRKAPVPDAAAIAEMEATIREEFKSYFARAKAKGELATRLFDSAKEPPGEPVRRYVLLETSRAKAVEAGDAELAGDALEELTTKFAIDPVERAEETFTGLSKSAKSPEQATALIELCKAAIGEARELDHYEAARHGCEIAAAAARKIKETAVAKEFLAQAKQIDEDRKAYEAATAARETLQTKADDPDANLVVGKFLCFIKGSWREGLERLVRGGDAELKSLADGDLSHPFEAERQAALADRWWSVAETLPDREKQQVQAHAAWWYERATSSGQLEASAAAAIKKKLAGLTPPSTSAGRRARPIDRVVLWNEHNSNFNNSGTRRCNIILLRDGDEVWRQDGVRVQWSAGRDVSTEVSVPKVKADTVRIEVLARIGNSGGLAEVEVYSGDQNLARECPARASAENANDRRTAATLTDGNTSSEIHEVGYWLLPDGQEGWAEIEIKPPARYGSRLAGAKSGREKGSREKGSREKSTRLRITQAVLRKLFHGKASFSNNTGILELAYDFSNKEQLLDFGVTDPDNFQKGLITVEADGSLRHCAKFLTVSVTGQMMVGDLEGEHLRTTGGVTVRGFQNGDSLSVHVRDREKKLNWTSGGGDFLRQVATGFNLSVTPLAVAWTIPTYTLKVPAKPSFAGPTTAGQVELCGGSKGDSFSNLLIQGVVDPEWAAEFFAEKR